MRKMNEAEISRLFDYFWASKRNYSIKIIFNCQTNQFDSVQAHAALNLSADKF